MKIGIDISQIVYGTGVSRYYSELVKSLLKINSNDQFVLFGTSFRAFSQLEKFKNEIGDQKNISFRLFKIPPIFFEIIWNKLKIFPIERLIGNVDVFHTSDWLEPPASKFPKVTTIHDMVVYLFPSSLPKRIVRNQKNKLKIVESDSSHIIADSETTRKDVIRFLNINPEKISTIYLAASEKFKPEREDVVQKCLTKYKIKKPFLLSVGTREPRKNLEFLIDVFEKISPDYPNLTLVLTGKKGWGITSDVSGNIVSTGYIEEHDLKALYSACHVFVYPSLYEGFGLPVLEAMACRAPVITSNNSSMAEIAKNAAILIDPRSKPQLEKAIRLVLELDQDNYQKMVRASLNRARQFSWIKTAKKTMDIYKKAIPK